MTDQPDDLCEPDNPAAYDLARHIADHPVSTIQAAFRYLNAPLAIELHEEASAGVTPAADETERRDRYAEALWPLTDWDGDRLNAERAADAVMAIADAEQAELRRLLAQAQAEAHQYRTALQGAARRAATPPPAAAPAVDRAALRDRIAAAIVESDGVPSFEFAAKLHWAAALREADAVLAVLPPPVSRADVLREAADALDNSERLRDLTDDHMLDINAAANELRRLADETPDAEPARDCPACDAGIGHSEHCPTPETHKWGCGCHTEPAAEARCTCADAGACFAPADHYADCPAAGARQDGVTP